MQEKQHLPDRKRALSLAPAAFCAGRSTFTALGCCLTAMFRLRRAFLHRRAEKAKCCFAALVACMSERNPNYSPGKSGSWSLGKVAVGWQGKLCRSSRALQPLHCPRRGPVCHPLPAPPALLINISDPVEEQCLRWGC